MIEWEFQWLSTQILFLLKMSTLLVKSFAPVVSFISLPHPALDPYFPNYHGPKLPQEASSSNLFIVSVDRWNWYKVEIDKNIPFNWNRSISCHISTCSPWQHPAKNYHSPIIGCPKLHKTATLVNRTTISVQRQTWMRCKRHKSCIFYPTVV